ncbi:MAG TPA: thiolase family protein, partial [Candidatus Hydrogenedentes bacterium]|nr:thiolase family protein [Candidatus Hydrogenedentota bacterium]
MAVTFGKEGCRAVVVAGVRTPFLRSFGAFTALDTIALGTVVVKELLKRTELKAEEIDGLIWGGVVLPSASVNIGREIVIDSGIPRSVEGTTITRACTSGLMAITQAAAAIERGEADTLIAGGSDSTSNAEVTMPSSLVHKAAPVLLSGKAGVKDYFRLLARLSIRRDLIPKRPSVRERSTGELMGQAAERMAKINGISREAQDALALQSHHRAAAAIESGRLTKEIVPVVTPEGKTVDRDNIVRGDTTLEKLARLKPAFAKDGTLTAGNSSSLTDGASAVLVMHEDKARALGYTPLAAFRSWSYDAVDPSG